MQHNVYIHLGIMVAATFAVRVLPLTLIQRQIRSRFLRSFLFYVPYATLSVMTFPAIIEATKSPLSGAAAMAVGVLAAWLGASLFQVSLSCCAIVFLLELFL